MDLEYNRSQAEVGHILNNAQAKVKVIAKQYALFLFTSVNNSWRSSKDKFTQKEVDELVLKKVQ